MFKCPGKNTATRSEKKNLSTCECLPKIEAGERKKRKDKKMISACEKAKRQKFET